MLRNLLLILLCVSIIITPTYAPAAAVAAPPQTRDAASIDALLKKSYLELLELAPELSFTAQQFEQTRKRLKSEEEKKKDDLKSKEKAFEKQIQQLQGDLKKLNQQSSTDTEQVAAQRHDLHCRIQAIQSQLADTKIELNNGVPVEYENLHAKVDLMEKWPAARREISRQIETGQARSRRWGDVEDIGFRVIEANQEDDIKSGQEAVQQLKQLGLLPKDVQDPEVTEYINRVAMNIARNSDLKVPLNVTVLGSKEINAFALPGGFLFINHGLILEAKNEAQLAGVIAHEISHDVARHGHRLMKKATIASLIYQAAQIGALIFTGGAVGIGTYYALQYGFQGLGLLLSLQLLGVSRDYELEADQLGVQYVWKAGYDPEGFIQFFDIIASKEGYVEKTSFFRTHPAFYDRIVDSYREISFLPKQEQAIENTKEFEAVQAKLKKISEDLEKEDENAPSLFKKEKGCPAELDKAPGATKPSMTETPRPLL